MINDLRNLVVLGVAGMAFLVVSAGPGPAAEPLPLDIGGDFSLVDQRGDIRRSEEFDGRLKLVWFGYTECPHACPMALGTISAALDEMGADAESVIPLFVTVDPEHDTPDRMATLLANFHPSFVGLTGVPDDIAQVRADYRAAAQRIADSGAFERLFEHTTLIYLMGRGGEPLSLLPAMLPPERIAEIIRGYL